MRELVQEIVEGDFDQLATYDAKLSMLEEYIAAQTDSVARHNGSAPLLEAKESELRVYQRYMLQLQSALSGIAMPDYLREFTTQVWSQALTSAVRRHGPDSDLAKRFRAVGRDVVMSVQPKGSPPLRKRFLMQLPAMMRDLNEGLRLIGWPDAAQKAFFARLLPSHAESLKGQSMTELEHNLLANSRGSSRSPRRRPRIPGARSRCRWRRRTSNSSSPPTRSGASGWSARTAWTGPTRCRLTSRLIWRRRPACPAATKPCR